MTGRLRSARQPAAVARRMVVLAAGWVVIGVLSGVAGVLLSAPDWIMWPSAVAAVGTALPGCLAAAASGEGLVRLFWQRFALAVGFLVVATVSQAYDSATADESAGPLPLSPRTGLLYLAAVSTAVLALLWLPGRRRTWRAALAMCLDVAVVAVAAALVAAQFTRVATILVPDTTLAATLRLIVLAVACAGVVAVVKVGMTGTGPVDSLALWLLTPIGLISPVTLALTPVLSPWPQLNPTAVMAPLVGLLLALSARAQTNANVDPAPPAAQALPADGRPRRGVWQRSISVVPYAAIAVTVTMLLSVTVRTGHLPSDLATGSAVLIMLVVIRQLVALVDNVDLLDRVAHLAHHDELTGLPNRRLFTTVLQARTAATTVALCDLDGFAALNDQLGDEHGDAVLRAAADRLSACVGADAMVARLQADDFGVLVPGHHRLAAPDRLADTLLAAFRTPLRVAGHELLVTATVGVADGQQAIVADLLRRADVALQAAKRAGINRAQRHTPALDTTAQHCAHLAASLRRGLEQHEFRLLYQPIVRLPDAAMVAVEALVRWYPGDGHPVSPAEFIPVAEHTGLIIELGAWILDTACADARAWQQRHGTAAPRLSVNVSARQLLDPDLPRLVAATLARHELPARLLTLEITETAVFTGGAALATVEALRAIGVGIALDDFGTGHSSLTLLRTCPVTVLKVDKSFIDDLNGTTEQEAIAAALASLATDLGLYAVAEGVEAPAQAERLHAMGYRYAQGFHFARPQTSDQIEAALHAGRVSQ